MVKLFCYECYKKLDHYTDSILLNCTICKPYLYLTLTAERAARGDFKKYHYVNQFLLKIELARHHKFDRQVTNQEECGIHEN